MKPEPLKNKYIIEECISSTKSYKLIEVKRIKAAVEWYKKYRNNYTSFIIDYPKYKEYLEDMLSRGSNELYNGTSSKAQIALDLFNNWLFDKAFEDITKEK